MQLLRRRVIIYELAMVVVHDRQTTDADHRHVDRHNGWVVTELIEGYHSATSAMSQDVEMIIVPSVRLRLEGTAAGMSTAVDETGV